MFVVYHSSNI